MRITDIVVRSVDLGVQERYQWNALRLRSTGRLSFGWLEVRTDEGITGYALGGGQREIVEGPLKRMLVGEDPSDIERLWEKMYRTWRKPLAKGEAIAALSGVDIALWDLRGQALGQPVHKLLGAYADRVRIYAAGGYYTEGKTIDDLVAEMASYVEGGFSAVKMKIGGASFREDVERVKAVREAIGEDIDLMIDANNIFTAYEAIRFGRAVEKYNIFWFEEPVEPDDLQGALEVKEALDMPIASGENEYTRYGSREWLASRAVDIFQADLRLCGGISEWMKIAALASAYHIKMAPHGMPHISIHALASCSNGLILEIIPRQETYKFLPKLQPDPDGMVEVPKGPGLSIAIDEEALARVAQGSR